MATPAVFQLTVRVALAPTASPAIVCVPTVTPPAVPSVSTTSKLVVTSCPPTFCTVTTTGTVSPCVTRAGAVMAVRATSVTGSLTGIVTKRWSLTALSSARVWRANRSWSPVTVGVQAKLRVVVAPAARPATLCVPTVTCSVVSCRVTSKLDTFWLPTFLTVTVMPAVVPGTPALGPLTLVTARSVSGPGGGGAKPSIETPNRLRTRSIRLAMVTVELPAKSSATGFRLPSSVTMREPESPPPLNVPGSMMNWST